MIRAICIDDTNRPSEIPVSHWVKKNKEYTITHIYKMVKFNNEMGVTLKEIDLLTLKNCPYEQFKISRFAIHEDDLSKFLKLAQDCGDLNDVDIARLMKEVDEYSLLPVLK